MIYNKNRLSYLPIELLKKLQIGQIMVKNIEKLIQISNIK